MVDVLVKHDIRVISMKDKSGSSDSVFIQDPYIETPTHIVVGKFRNPTRILETSNIRTRSSKPVRKVERGFLEGGDYLYHRGISFVMAGPRTSRLAIRDLMVADAFGTHKVARITSTDSTIIHLDLMLGFIDDVAVIWSGAKMFIVDVYERGGNKIASLPLADYLKHLGYRIFEITDDEQRKYMCNFVCFDKFVLATEGSGHLLRKATKKPVICVPLSELGKMGGGVHCAMKQKLDA
jgi:N-dimethylarginine dimethylaminohydrolase